MRTIINAGLLARVSLRSTSVTCISSHHSFLQPSSARLQSTSLKVAEVYTYCSGFFVKPEKVIAKSLEEYKLNHWGFVIYRCTYGSQEKWDKFLALAKQEAHNYLKRSGKGDLWVYDKMDWTVIEDAETLDGASILDTSRKFRAWVEANGRVEIHGSIFTDVWPNIPRYSFFMYVDEESLESVVDEEKAKDRDAGYFCKIVYPVSVEIREDGRLSGEIPDDQDLLDEQRELLDCIKKVNLGSLVSLYALLVPDVYSWYTIWVDSDYDSVGIAEV